MKLEEAYIIWKKQYNPDKCGMNCINAEDGSGPGYVGFGGCAIHKDVVYGRKYCPENCKDFKLRPSCVSVAAFWKKCHSCPDVLHRDYGIDVNTIDEIIEEREENENQMKRYYESTAEQLSKLHSVRRKHEK